MIAYKITNEVTEQSTLTSDVMDIINMVIEANDDETITVIKMDMTTQEFIRLTEKEEIHD